MFRLKLRNKFCPAFGICRYWISVDPSTNGEVKNIISTPASLAWRSHETPPVLALWADELNLLKLAETYIGIGLIQLTARVYGQLGQHADIQNLSKSSFVNRVPNFLQ